MDIAPGGSVPHDPGMEARIGRLEDQFSRIEVLLQGIDDRIRRLDERVRLVEIDLAEVKGRIQNLPGIWPVRTAIAAGQATLAAVLFGALKVSGH